MNSNENFNLLEEEENLHQMLSEVNPSEINKSETALNSSNSKKNWIWSEVLQHGATPTARSLHIGLVIDDFLYIFGGYDGSQRTNDFYKYNFITNEWIEIQSSENCPLPRDRHSGVVYGKSIYIFGGYDGVNRVNDLYKYDTERNKWEEIIPQHGCKPSPRHSHSAIIHRDHMYIFAGYDGLYKNDFHKFNLKTFTWSSLKDNNPSAENWPKPRYRTSCNLYKNKMYIFGGHDGVKQLNDFYSFDFANEIWTQIICSNIFSNQLLSVPTPRDSHISIVYKDSLFIFGGSVNCNSSLNYSGGYNCDFYQYKFDEEKWYQVEPNDAKIPPPRFCHIGIIYNKSLYIFGGYDGTIRLNDFLRFQFEPDYSNIPQSNLIQDISGFINNSLFSDVKLIVGTNKIEIYGHKLFLIRSSFFKAMFENEMKEKNQSLVNLPDVKYEIFLYILQYLYTDKINVKDMNISKWIEIYELADLFGVERLQKICENHLIDNLDYENSPSILKSFDNKGHQKLREYALNYIVKNFDFVSKTATFENFIRTNIDILLEILKKR